MRAFHGTSLKNAIAIITGSTCKDVSGAWTVSDCDDMFYFHPYDKMLEDSGYEDDEDEAIIDYAIRKTVFHGQLSSSLISSFSDYYCIIEMDIPGDIIMDDTSCPSMDNIASCISCSDMSKIEFLKVHCGTLSQYDKPFILAQVFDNILVNSSNIDPALLDITSYIDTDSDKFINKIEELEERELVEHSIDSFKETFITNKVVEF